jgi:DNA-binding MarR family transcriptional regulator
MVTKTISPQNQRNTYIELTDKGRETTELFIKMRDERFRTLFEAINVTEEEKEVLYNVLNRATRFFKQRFDTANVRNNNILINNSGSALVQSKGET